MSDDNGRLPSTAGRGVAVAAAVGTLALAGHDVAALVGLAAGLAFGATLRGFDGSHRRVAAAAAAFPIPVSVTAVVIAVSVSTWGGFRPITAALVLAAALVGAAVVPTRPGWPSPSAFLRSGYAALVAAIGVGAAALFAVQIDLSGGLRPVLEPVLWLTGTGVRGLVWWLVLAGLAVAGGLVAVPPAAFTGPYRRDERTEMRTALAWIVVFATGVAVVALAVTALIAPLAPPLEGFLSGVARSLAVRGLLATVALAGVALLALNAIALHSWHQTDGRENLVVPTVVGGALGAAVCASGVAALGATGVPADDIAALLGATVVALGAAWIALWWCAETLEVSGLPTPPTVVAVALAGGGVAVAATGDSAAAGIDAVRGAFPGLAAIAAALFAYDVGRYGRTIEREVGLEGTARRPQLVRLGWNGAVAVVGVVVAAVGLWAATAFAPTLSVPATLGVLVGVGAVLAGARLLLR